MNSRRKSTLKVMWWIYALLSALFAALTAIFAKIGIKNVDTDLATAVRTVVVLMLAWAIAFFRGGTNSITSLTKQNIIFLVLSGVATGLSWIFYFKALQLGKISQVAPIDKLSVALAIAFSVIFLGETLTLKNGYRSNLYYSRNDYHHTLEYEFTSPLQKIENGYDYHHPHYRNSCRYIQRLYRYRWRPCCRSLSSFLPWHEPT